MTLQHDKTTVPRPPLSKPAVGERVLAASRGSPAQVRSDSAREGTQAMCSECGRRKPDGSFLGKMSFKMKAK